mmetsp:Transcript_78634/g.163453  ORF Transcript_78634/g.163453 Transcript_78634/m.163453 type:complete len:619 (+) Transcript_78634:142-1998(+)|eukprot:CAMPEP_0206516532 /NCGR_PEP_ID=MMETSP0324_2-20121206/63424_1 /ASSEMBLY_ACC=CAM_ASM_000836 /TAXON_ID=2866 /ORGANISM="Crypthecodinium cohnii, Strain Seligo" /LENGTH=618 /DNA_ID=CAMNT_0054009485 /DNA_START=21 /DNA_END=1877 /DNA_ORIENTATION=+
MPKLLALPAPESDADKETLVVCGLCFSQKRCEPAGRSFHAVHEKPLIEAKQKPSRAKQDKQDDSDDEPPANASWKRKKKDNSGGGKSGSSGTLKLSDLLTGVDLYELLDVNPTATADQIKKQYRKLALQHHPDKANQGDAEVKTSSGLSSKEQYFVQIQEAYEVLSDESKRRQYDSTLDFDDDVPEEVDEKLGFFGTFGPVFRRNSRWSERLPVPELGDENTDMNKVYKFYDFWCSFESWRDFSMHDEYNVNDAEFREERRWMERQNQRVRKKFEQDERKRILRLAEIAERLDPRIKAEKEAKEAKKREEKERRARAKQEEEDAKLRALEEKRLQEEKDKAEKEEQERQEREQNRLQKEALKKLRQRAKKAIQGKCSPGPEVNHDFQEMLLALDGDKLEPLCQRLEGLSGKDDKVLAALEKIIESWKSSKAQKDEADAKKREETRLQREAKAAEEKKQAAAAAVENWSPEELAMLTKGLAKFPGGTGGRWGMIAQHLSINGYPRTEKEIIDKTKSMADGQSLRAMGSGAPGEHAAFKIPKAGTQGAAAAAEAQTAASPDAASEWTPEQQKQLEAALQKHPATLEKNERWRLIAAEVPGKTKSQCVERFKFLKEQMKKK